MKQKSFHVLFFLKKNKIKANGEAPISMRITVDKRFCEMFIRRSTLVENWDQTKGKLKTKDKLSTEINMYIDTVRAKVQNIHRQLEADNLEISAKEICSRFCGVEEKQKTLIEVFEEHNKEIKQLEGKGYAQKTIIRFEGTVRYLKEFLKKEYKKPDINLKDIDLPFIQKFDTFLKTEKNCAQNTAITRLKQVKKIMRIAYSNDWIQKDPFMTYRFKFEETNIEFLTQEELNSIIQKEFSIERLSTVKDIFLFQCFTGLAFSDIEQLKSEHLLKDNNGSLWIRKNRQKTNNMCNIPLITAAKVLIDKYANHPGCIEKNVLFPVPTNQRMNSYLKEIADLCGITKKLSTHVARHTAATIVFLANKVSLENVAKILGHSNVRTTQHYAKVLDSSIMRDMQEVDKQFTL
ncbi:site-specific integrase [Dysgonomonas capnocytophagoides]|uniref:Site-specific integrase n=1 Tax=Dysgonomonas capnocytophagoides TaxID=45254 RepID=A0A4Y8KWX4_9BACT|nr:site-specific integrase [Dysgonomonas capnocytophagoides]TFD93778.1 site-specific integrase [Dysgonomonas capnocytophagoides]